MPKQIMLFFQSEEAFGEKTISLFDVIWDGGRIHWIIGLFVLGILLFVFFFFFNKKGKKSRMKSGK